MERPTAVRQADPRRAGHNLRAMTLDRPAETGPNGAPARAEAELVPASLRSAAAYSWRILLIVAIVVVAGLAFTRLRPLLAPVIAALFLAVPLVPLANRLRRHHIPNTAATIVAMLMSLVVVAGALVIVEQRATNRIASLDFSLQEGLARVGRSLARTGLVTEREVVTGIDRASAEFLGAVGGAGGIISGATVGLNVLAQAAIALFILFFFVRDGPRLWASLVGLFGRRRSTVDQLGRRAWRTLGAYVRGIVLVAAFDAALIGAAMRAIGVPFVATVTLLTFVGAFTRSSGRS